MGLTLSGRDSVWDDFELTEKPKPVLAFQADPVALSCANYRYWTTTRALSALNDCTVNDDDRALAERIRQYYGHKLTMIKLRGRTLSKFQEKLGAYLVGQYELVQGDEGIVYRLPFFYHEDRAEDELFEKFSANSPPLPGQSLHRRQRLYPVSSVYKSRKYRDKQVYWWNTDHNTLVQWSVDAKSDFQPLVQSLFDRGAMDVVARFQRRHLLDHPDFAYMQMTQVRLT